MKSAIPDLERNMYPAIRVSRFPDQIEGTGGILSPLLLRESFSQFFLGMVFHRESPSFYGGPL